MPGVPAPPLTSALEATLPLTAVRAVHPGWRGAAQVIAAAAVPMIAAAIDRAEIPSTLKRTSRTLHPDCPDWRHRDPLVFAGQAHSGPAQVRLSVCLGLCDVYHRHGF